MTTLQLTSYLLLAWFLQLAGGVVFILWQKRNEPRGAAVIESGSPPPVSTAAWAGWRDFRVVCREFEDTARSQCSFYLEPVDGIALPPHLPGQFLTFALQISDPADGPQAAKRTVTRCYSLSDAPDTAAYRITVKRVGPPGEPANLPPGISSGYFHDEVHVGDVLKVKAPSGQFVIDADAALPAVLVAGGIGITPLLSMLRWCMVHQPQRALYLYYGVRNGSEHAFKRVFAGIATGFPHIHVHVAYSRAGLGDVKGQDYHHAGHVDVELLRRTLPAGRHQFYVCGPPSMMASLIPALAAWGVPSGDIRFEAFGPASMPPAAPNQPALPALPGPVDVQWRRAGRTLSWDGRYDNLLDFAESHGVAVESGCRAGSCGACETKLISGAVGYDHPPDHDVAPGFCLLCVGKPQSALVLEA